MLQRASFAVLVCLAGCAVDPSESEQSAALTAPAAVVDLADRLAAIPGMTVDEQPVPAPGYRHFILTFQQPVDHRRPHGATFGQRIVLVHRDETRPMVLGTEGYDIYPPAPYYGALARSLAGNRLTVEHRFFGGSIPSPANTRYLTIDQAAADHHRVVQALKPIYTAAWVSTGASKGGMTASYHRRRYPHDVEGTVADVAPMSFGPRDVRYTAFLDRVGDADCRAKTHAFQRAVLARRAALVPQVDALVASYGDALTALPGGASQALDIAIGEFHFAFWQYGDASLCEYIPAPDASDDELLGFLDSFGMFAVGSDVALEQFGSYYYQAATQFGFPRLDTAQVRDLLQYNPNDYTPYVAQYGQLPAFDWTAMLDMALWTMFRAEDTVFVYGENDPWTAGAYPVLPGNPRNVVRYTVAAGNHGSSFVTLAPADQAAFLALLEGWTGVTPIPPPPPMPVATTLTARAVDGGWLGVESPRTGPL